MSEHNRIDRRTLLKIMGSAGATAVVSSACGTAGAESGAGLTGGKFDKTVALFTDADNSRSITPGTERAAR